MLYLEIGKNKLQVYTFTSKQQLNEQVKPLLNAGVVSSTSKSCTRIRAITVQTKHI
jgi:hypothetical protein